MKWEYAAVVLFENGKQKDVTGKVEASDRLTASKFIRTMIRERWDDVKKVLVDELEEVK